MPKKDTKKKPDELLNMEELEKLTSIESSLDLDSITLKKKRWQAKIYVNETLPRSYRSYRIVLNLDEQPYLDRIDEIKKEFEGTLFTTDKGSVKMHNEKIKELTNQLLTLRNDCEEIKFIATVEELKYKDSSTLLTIRIPDDVVEPLNRQKMRLDIYKITLIPL